MGLLQVATNTVTSAVSSVSLTGIDSDDVYKVTFSNIFASADDDMQIRVTTSGTADSDSEYDIASLDLKTSGTFGNTSGTNQSKWDFSAGIGTSGTNSHNGIMYLFNFNNSSEFSFVTMENATTRQDTSDELFGFQGGGVHTVAETNDGINFFLASGNIASGTFTLYKVV
jgi:hypothetical protein